jgi:hypothetical protein
MPITLAQVPPRWTAIDVEAGRCPPHLEGHYKTDRELEYECQRLEAEAEVRRVAEAAAAAPAAHPVSRAELRALVQRHGTALVGKLIEIALSPRSDPSLAARCAESALHVGYGRAPVASDSADKAGRVMVVTTPIPRTALDEVPEHLRGDPMHDTSAGMQEQAAADASHADLGAVPDSWKQGPHIPFAGRGRGVRQR